ncbi:MAG: hypothetical protein IKX02_04625 [Spirochaetales bacterium]|nr:hypothetical protein [Spirochaetales bacterium]
MRKRRRLMLSVVLLAVTGMLWILGILGLVASILVWAFHSWSLAWKIALPSVLSAATMPWLYLICHRLAITARKALEYDDKQHLDYLSQLRKKA